MKIKTRRMSYEEVMALPRPAHKKPLRPLFVMSSLIRLLSQGAMWKTGFTHTVIEKDNLPKGPYLILMNHSSFIDLKIASKIFFPHRFAIVSTMDGMVGKSWLMRLIGCIPTQKFVTDLTLIRDMKYMLKKKNTSVLMFPEAGYSFDGCATTLPDKLGGLLKLLDVPVLMVTTQGAFARDPLYNGLQLRKVKVSAEVRCLLRQEEIKEKSVEELDEILHQAFSFDNFAWQYENNVEICESFRADGLERILYKCACCGAEGQMEGKGTTLTCHACGKVHEMDVLGRLCATEGETRFAHIPSWYRWERQCVRDELENRTYSLETDVEIGMMVDHKALYLVGDGKLTHDENGFVLTGRDGKLFYTQKPLASHCLNSDYFWYEIGDMVSIGNRDALYYCFPKTAGVVTKTRLAAEELYKMKAKENRRVPKVCKET